MGEARVLYVDEEVAPDADFAITIAETGAAGPRFLSRAPRPDEDGYFALWLPPLSELMASGPVPRAVTFCVDVSASMRGGKLEAVQEALAGALSFLEPEDLIGVVAYSSLATAYSAELSPATVANLQGALEFVRLLEPSGATSFEAALRLALGVPEPDRPHHVVLLTDGLATVGIQEVAGLDAIVDAQADVRVYAIGVGDVVDRAFLRALAEGHDGRAAFVPDDQEMSARLRELFDEFSRPTMSVTAVDFVGLDVTDLVPREIELLEAGQELFQVGRYRTGGSSSIRISGMMLGRSVILDYPLAAVVTPTQQTFVPRIWAHSKVLELERELAYSGANAQLLGQILDLGLTYRLVTSRTALFAPDDQVVIDPQPANSPVSPTAVADPETLPTLSWGGHDFRWADGAWLDVRYHPGTPLVDVDSATPELPRALSHQLGAYAGLGVGCVVVLEGTAYRLSARTPHASPLAVGPNAPNPFNAGTCIPYVLPSDAARVAPRLAIYAISGQLVWSALLRAAAGPGKVRWDGRDQGGAPAASGVYLVQLRCGERLAQRRLVLAR